VRHKHVCVQRHVERVTGLAQLSARFISSIDEHDYRFSSDVQNNGDRQDHKLMDRTLKNENAYMQ
jgi:hypothetical protein